MFQHLPNAFAVASVTICIFNASSLAFVNFPSHLPPPPPTTVQINDSQLTAGMEIIALYLSVLLPTFEFRHHFFFKTHFNFFESLSMAFLGLIETLFILFLDVEAFPIVFGKDSLLNTKTELKIQHWLFRWTENID